MKKFCAVLALSFGVFAAAAAQQPVRHYVLGNTQIVPLKSQHTGQAHELIIILPDSYASNPTKKYPVLYFLDAYWDTPTMAAIHGHTVYDKLAPEHIMVGLSYPDGANYDMERVRDYTFTSIPQIPAGSGKGSKFLDFIRSEVAPLIEAKYRGDKANRIIAGASLGGLFALDVALRDPDFFAGYIALTPAVVWDDRAIFKQEEAFAKSNKPINARIFINVGGAEPAEYRDQVIAYSKQLASRNYKGLALQSVVAEGMGHATTKGDGYIRGLKWIWESKAK